MAFRKFCVDHETLLGFSDAAEEKKHIVVKVQSKILGHFIVPVIEQLLPLKCLLRCKCYPFRGSSTSPYACLSSFIWFCHLCSNIGPSSSGVLPW